MNIGLGRSTMAYMIADPLAVLAENEVHIGFSNMFRDSKSGFNENMLHDVDVLVARLPAHLPSDIQKVYPDFKIKSVSNSAARFALYSSPSYGSIEILWSFHQGAKSH